MANAYANLKTIKSVSLLDIAGSSHDSRLLELLEDVSRWVDQHCNRHFFSLQATRAFDVEGGSSRILVPDLIRITALKSDSDGDNRFETAWASGDYRLYPLNAEPNQPWGRPYSRIEVGSGGRGRAEGRPRFPAGKSAVQIAGVWGFREELRTSAAVVDGKGVDSSGGSFGVNGGMPFSAGDTLLIGSEQLYVTAVGTNMLTAVRGVNGTRAAHHAASSAVQVYRYPAGVAEACLVQTARMWKRKDMVFGGDAQFYRRYGERRPCGLGPRCAPDAERLSSACGIGPRYRPDAGKNGE